MRKSKEVPELKSALDTGVLSLPTAARIAPLLNFENKNEWINHAKELTTRELERKIVMLNPEAIPKERIIPKAAGISELRLALKDATVDALEIAKDLLSQSLKKSATTEDTISIALFEYIERHSPVEKAERAARRLALSALKVKDQQTARTISAPSTVMPPSHRFAAPKVANGQIVAEIRHRVNFRDRGQCTATLLHGKRCTNRRHLEMHHIIPRSIGGPNTVSNLTTLCFSHHRYLHKI